MSEFLPIQLPSKCISYGVSPETITVRPYTGSDEITLSQINPVNVESKYLQILRDIVKGIDVTKLTLGDRLYIILWEYINSYSEYMKVRTVCTHCLESIEPMVDLRKLEVITLPDNFQQPYHVMLPSGGSVDMRLLTVGDQIEIEKFPNAGESYLFKWARSIVSEKSVVEVMYDLTKFSGKDMATIRSWHEKMYHGPEMLTKFQCPKCGNEEEVEVPFRLNFIFPDGQTLTDTFGAGI
jgi:hypothetical protein